MSDVLAESTFVQVGIAFHACVIVGCILLTRTYYSRNDYLPSFAKWWSDCLTLVFMIYVFRLGALNMRAGNVHLAVEGVISNVANLCLLAMAREIGGTSATWRSLATPRLAILAVSPLLVFALLQYGFGVADAQVWTHVDLSSVLIRLPSALFSAIALWSVATSLRAELVSLKMAAARTFWWYGVHQAVYCLVPLLILAGPGPATVCENVYMNSSFLFKIACTLIVTVASAEVAKRKEPIPVAVHSDERRKAAPDVARDLNSLVDEFRNNVVVISGLRSGEPAIEKALQAAGFGVLSATARTDPLTLLEGIPQCKVGVLLTRENEPEISQRQQLAAKNLLAQRKQLLAVVQVPDGRWSMTDSRRLIESQEIGAAVVRWLKERAMLEPASADRKAAAPIRSARE